MIFLMNAVGFVHNPVNRLKMALMQCVSIYELLYFTIGVLELLSTCLLLLS
jgi:hypothetical protein